MSQEWYRTIDDYGIALFKANLAMGTKGYPGLLARIGISNPIGFAMVAGANALALGALVALDPAGLRGGSGNGSSSIEVMPPLEMQASQAWHGGIGASSGMVKDEEGLIIWM